MPRSGQVAGGSDVIGGPFELVDATGRTVTDRGCRSPNPSLLYFGYTFCPDVCPLDTARNAEAVDLLEDRG
jgi:protein SCO1/2